MKTLALRLAALATCACAPRALNDDLRVSASTLTALQVADVMGVPAENLASVGVRLLVVSPQESPHLEMRLRDGTGACDPNSAGVLRWSSWSSVPMVVEVETGCDARRFNQAVSHALLHALDVKRGVFGSRGLGHVDSTDSVLRAPRSQDWSSQYGIESLYGGSSSPERVTASDEQHFGR